MKSIFTVCLQTLLHIFVSPPVNDAQIPSLFIWVPVTVQLERSPERW